MPPEPQMNETRSQALNLELTECGKFVEWLPFWRQIAHVLLTSADRPRFQHQES